MGLLQFDGHFKRMEVWMKLMILMMLMVAFGVGTVVFGMGTVLSPPDFSCFSEIFR